MDCIVTITMIGGQEVILTTDQISTPDYETWCFTDEEYVERIMEKGVIIEVLNPDGSVTTTGYSPHCLCQVDFLNSCDI